MTTDTQTWEDAAREYRPLTELDRLRLELDGLRKANALLMAGMGSQCELYDAMKQQFRKAEAENAALHALVTEFADHCEGSGWTATAAELRRRAREAKGGGG